VGAPFSLHEIDARQKIEKLEQLFHPLVKYGNIFFWRFKKKNQVLGLISKILTKNTRVI